MWGSGCSKSNAWMVANLQEGHRLRSEVLADARHSEQPGADSSLELAAQPFPAPIVFTLAIDLIRLAVVLRTAGRDRMLERIPMTWCTRCCAAGLSDAVLGAPKDGNFSAAVGSYSTHFSLNSI